MANKLKISLARWMTPLIAIALAIGTSTLVNAQTGSKSTTLQHSVVLDGLESPWDMAFLEDGTMLFTEKCKGLSVRLPSGDVRALLGIGGVEGYASTAEDLFCDGQAGMMGVAFDPDFTDNRRIYLYSTSNKSNPHTNRLIRFVLNENFSALSARKDIVEDVPYKMAASDHPFGASGTHNGGRIRFSPTDGMLFLTTGDNHNGELPQSPTRMGGKVFRIDTDGRAAPDNNPPKGFDPRIYTYGHRNVQGIAFHPGTGTPIVAEHGPWHSDEVTVLMNGGNGGWDPRPNMAGRASCPDDYCGYTPNQMDGMNRFQRAAYMPMTDFKTYPDAMPPIWNNNGWSQGLSSAAFLEGAMWGEWDGALVIGFMGIGFGGTPVGQRIDLLHLSADGTSVVDAMQIALPMRPGRFRSLVLGPDGSLYTAVDEGSIDKFTPTSSIQAGAEPASAGETIYEDLCANCHGPTAQGMAIFPKLTGTNAEYIVARLNQYRSGETVGPNSALMAPWAKELTDEDIVSLAAYITTAFN